MQPWDLNALLLRRIELHLAGANWQRGGGKTSTRPKAIELPGEKAQRSRSDGGDVAQRLRNLGLIPGGDTSEPVSPSVDALAVEADNLWLKRQQALSSE